MAAMAKNNKGISGTFPARATPLLDVLNDEGPEPLRRMNVEQLVDLADEVRWQVLDAVSVTGGHLGSALGVVELTVALHHVFETPRDEICWDVAHQVYPHKVLTGRRGQIYTLRQGGGLSGFAKRAESKYDCFGAGHSATSISAALGFQVAKDFHGKQGHSIAVIGDGAITGGMAWEAINHAGGLNSKMMVILNDNGQVSLPTFYNSVDEPVGALSRTLARQSIDESIGVRAMCGFKDGCQNAKDIRSVPSTAVPTKDVLELISAPSSEDQDTEYDTGLSFRRMADVDGCKKAAVDDMFVKRRSTQEPGGELFEQFGFHYVGPIDGHDLETLVPVLEDLKKSHSDGRIQKPILLHVKTVKGKGYTPAEHASDKLHAVTPKFNVPKTSTNHVPKPPALALTTVFGESLVKEGERDDKIVAITAAMPGGTGVSIFENRFGPSRTFDVGIAEQHAVTFAGALAAGGLKPFCCIYSTFLQRGYDQVVHDVALQNLPVRFVLDRAGLVGADGPTHGGTFDLSFLACIPNMKICAPADEAELIHMTHTLAELDDCPSAMRYPRGASYGDVELPSEPEFLEPGKGRIVQEGRDGVIAILSVGSRLRESIEAAERLKKAGVYATVADARWVKPLDEELVSKLANDHRVMVTVEENSIGGFSAQVQQFLLESGAMDGCDRKPLVLRSMVLPDRFIPADEPKKQYDDAQLNASHIVTKALAAISRTDLKLENPPASGC